MKKISLFVIILMCVQIASAQNKASAESRASVESGAESETQSDVYSYTSTADRSQEFNRQGISFSTGVSPNVISLHPQTQYQTMDGFGAALTGASCYNILKMQPAARAAFIKEIFDTVDGLGYSYIRVSVGCSDFSFGEFTCWDNQGPLESNFALDDESINYVIPVIKEALAYNPNIKILASVWTPPRWMKVSAKGGSSPHNSWTGGHLNTAHYDNYAAYLIKWIRAYQAKCIPIYSLTVQNEPLNAGNSASMLMYWDEQRDFIKNALGQKLQQAGLNTKIYVFDHNFNYDDKTDQEDYPIKIYNDPDAAKYIAGAAYHNYGGSSEELNDIHSQRPDKELIFSETSIGTWTGEYDDPPNAFLNRMGDGIDFVSKWCKAVIVWNLMLDENRGPHGSDGACTTCYGVVDISDNYSTLHRNSHYYEIGHLSKVIKSGAVRISADGYSASGLQYQAFKNPDGSYAMVILNKSGSAKSFDVNDGTNKFNCSVPSKAAVSLRWK
jgi:glucosylceramidase